VLLLLWTIVPPSTMLSLAGPRCGASWDWTKKYAQSGLVRDHSWCNRLFATIDSRHRGDEEHERRWMNISMLLVDNCAASPVHVFMPVSSKSKYWQAFAVVQIIGGTLVVFGATSSGMVYMLGLVLLFPGSVMAATLPLQKLWYPALWHYWKTDPTGLSNLVYIPIALIFNFVAWWAFRFYRLRCESQAHH
jgi:hypothetical protein